MAGSGARPAPQDALVTVPYPISLWTLPADDRAGSPCPIPFTDGSIGRLGLSGFGAPKFIAPADPAARWTAAHRGPAFFAYSANYLIDVDNAIIVDVEATTAIRQAEILVARCRVERSLEGFDLYRKS